MNKKCIYCDNESKNKNGYWVCDNCKVVCYTENYNDSQKKEMILKFLTEKQSLITKDSTSLHKIAQKNINGEHLSDEENQIYENLMLFKEISVVLKRLLGENRCMNVKSIKEELYRLSYISEWLSEKY